MDAGKIRSYQDRVGTPRVMGQKTTETAAVYQARGHLTQARADQRALGRFHEEEIDKKLNCLNISRKFEA